MLSLNSFEWQRLAEAATVAQITQCSTRWHLNVLSMLDACDGYCRIALAIEHCDSESGRNFDARIPLLRSFHSDSVSHANPFSDFYFLRRLLIVSIDFICFVFFSFLFFESGDE